MSRSNHSLHKGASGSAVCYGTSAYAHDRPCRDEWIKFLELTDDQVVAWDYFQDWRWGNARLCPFEPDSYSPLSANAKVGSTLATLTWSIPRETSCWRDFPTGPRIATPACESVCYVTNLLQCRPDLNMKLLRNEEIRWESQFPQIFVGAAIEWQTLADFRKVKLIRLHTSGDFDSEIYVRQCIVIAQMLPHVKFFAYSRAWRRNELIPALSDLAALPNFVLHLSYDRDSGSPPDIPNSWTCPLLDKGDAPPELQATDCVAFRSRRVTNRQIVLQKPGVTLKWVTSGSKRTRVCLQEDASQLLPPSYDRCHRCLRRPPATGE